MYLIVDINLDWSKARTDTADQIFSVFRGRFTYVFLFPQQTKVKMIIQTCEHLLLDIENVKTHFGG